MLTLHYSAISLTSLPFIALSLSTNHFTTHFSVVNDCDYVLHVASPFPLEDDITVIDTAVNGTLYVLQACASVSSVKKVVLTSSCAAVNEGHEDENRVFTEDDWTNVENDKVQSYAISKTEAERAAWKFVDENEENQFKLTVINPTFVVGPVLIDTAGASISVSCFSIVSPKIILLVVKYGCCWLIIMIAFCLDSEEVPQQRSSRDSPS